MAGAAVRRQRQQIDMTELDLAGRRDRAHQRAQQRGLAGAVAADQAAHLAFVDAKDASRMIGIGPIETLRFATLSMAGAPDPQS